MAWSLELLNFAAVSINIERTLFILFLLVHIIVFYYMLHGRGVIFPRRIGLTLILIVSVMNLSKRKRCRPRRIIICKKKKKKKKEP
ncbi:hypothetical protein BCR41DRAFT_181052 [Lobosporangium transversale]|uniref:Uncharacterized protein n=1 Tax=Lobosporangium transversale TaxID=64571 RepID=A0A1Y2GZ07_9FUNG|nr:hypothetical protein BCR41DRAFT_181052 [Lobosporangium transversale]ORZ27034.1 hypothetical protein BCR41DRAFT_181052 [Lobosporangium transversale]|eukprot:XP_021884781.1 hypothetical protein BCR41DRAFT_181052 [Lobosporangium transversale]